jgi:hypothetical protein
MVLDDGTVTAGQYDPAQAAVNARKMVSDRLVVAAVGPQNSGCGKAAQRGRALLRRVGYDRGQAGQAVL